MFYLFNGRVGAKSLHLACATIALAVCTHAVVPAAEAQERRIKKSSRTAKAPPPLAANGPLTLFVSLNKQRMYVYDADGLMVQTPVSTGKRGHETPKGIYSILEKKVHHESNIYLGAKMPHMQRLTMTGIALHGGVIPGYPASGGCIRMPFDFARRFFNSTEINQRVVIAPDVHAPVAFEHAALFSALPSSAGTPDKRAEAKRSSFRSDVAEALGVSSAHAATEPLGRTLESAEEARQAERDSLADAVVKAGDRKVAAVGAEKDAGKALVEARRDAKKAAIEARKLARDAKKAAYALRVQERTLKKLSAQIEKSAGKMRADKLQELRDAEAAERARIAPATEDADRTAAAAKAADAASEAAAKAIDAAKSAWKEAKAEIKNSIQAEKAAKAEVARFERLEQHRELPVSVFISSARGTIAVRQGFERVLELPVTIDNPDQPLDTFLFTALDWKDDSRTDLRWSVAEVNENSDNEPDYGKSRKKKAAEVKMPNETDAGRAQLTLDRIKIPREAAQKIAEVVKPGSTLIVSSYDVSKSETRYAGTDFIVQMPEVVAKITRPTPRPRQPEMVDDYSSGFFLFGGPPQDSRRRRRSAAPKNSFW